MALKEGLPRWFSGKKKKKKKKICLLVQKLQETRVQLLHQEDPLE